jgi:uncharacterized protein
LARRVIDRGLAPAGELDASTDLLLRRRPRIAGMPPGTPLSADLVAESVAALEDSVLARLRQDVRRRAGDRQSAARRRPGWRRGDQPQGDPQPARGAEDVAHNGGIPFVGLKKGSKDHPETLYDGRYVVTLTDNDDSPPPREEVQLIAGTSWLFAREAMREAVDVLVIDEAGQVALADALAMAQGARSVILLGDPQVHLAVLAAGCWPV